MFRGKDLPYNFHDVIVIFVQEEGREPNNRLSQFSRLLRDKGGLFAEALLEAKDGTLLAPSDEAFEKVDRERLVTILTSKNSARC